MGGPDDIVDTQRRSGRPIVIRCNPPAENGAVRPSRLARDENARHSG